MNINEYLADFNKSMMETAKKAPATIKAFQGLFGVTMQSGAMTVAEKELVALGIAVAVQCEPCIKMHCKKSIEAGATKEQIMEAASVAVLMAGGPAYMHMTMVSDALDEL